MEHIMALGAGTGALKALSEEDDCPPLIQKSIATMAEVHAEACKLIVQLVNEELDAKRKAN